MAAKNSNKSKLKTIPALENEKMYVENWTIYRRLYDWGYNGYKRMQVY